MYICVKCYVYGTAGAYAYMLCIHVHMCCIVCMHTHPVGTLVSTTNVHTCVQHVNMCEHTLHACTHRVCSVCMCTHGIMYVCTLCDACILCMYACVCTPCICIAVCTLCTDQFICVHAYHVCTLYVYACVHCMHVPCEHVLCLCVYTICICIVYVYTVCICMHGQCMCMSTGSVCMGMVGVIYRCFVYSSDH